MESSNKNSAEENNCQLSENNKECKNNTILQEWNLILNNNQNDNHNNLCDNLQKELQVDEDLKVNSNEINNKNKLSYWVYILFLAIVGLQIVCSIFNFAVDIKIIIEIVSFILAILVLFGVLKGSKSSKNLMQIKTDIEKELNKKVQGLNIEKNSFSNKILEDINNHDSSENFNEVNLFGEKVNKKEIDVENTSSNKVNYKAVNKYKINENENDNTAIN